MIWKNLCLYLIPWVARWSPKGQEQDLAAEVWVNTLRKALSGSSSARGIYRDFYEEAEHSLRRASLWSGTCVPNGIWHTIPVPDRDFLGCLASAYTGVYELAELGAMTLVEQRLILRVAGLCRFDAKGDLVTPLGDPDVPVAQAVLDRCMRAVDTHMCRQGDGCDEFSILYWHEKKLHSSWLDRYIPLYKEF